MNAKSLQLLLVEDEEDSVELIKTAVKMGKLSFTVNVAYDGVEALAFLKQEPPFQNAPRPDVILLDLNMPRKSGREVLEEMKTMPHVAQTPVLFLTTTEWHDDLKQQFRLPTTQCLTKPMRFQEYIEMLKRIQDSLRVGAYLSLSALET